MLELTTSAFTGLILGLLLFAVSLTAYLIH